MVGRPGPMDHLGCSLAAAVAAGRIVVGHTVAGCTDLDEIAAYLGRG